MNGDFFIQAAVLHIIRRQAAYHQSRLCPRKPGGKASCPLAFFKRLCYADYVYKKYEKEEGRFYEKTNGKHYLGGDDDRLDDPAVGDHRLCAG